MSQNNNLYALFQQRFPVDSSQRFLTDDQGTIVSYADLEKNTAQLANYFTGLGLVKGDRIAVQMQKSPQVLMIYLAALRAGLVYLPLNTGYTDTELDYFLSDAKPRLLICDPQRLQSFQRLLADTGEKSWLKTSAQQGDTSLMQAARSCSDQFAPVVCQGSEIAAILYTSGTTGKSKGAMLSHKNLAANALTLADVWGWRADDVLLHALPVFHVHGLFVACHCVLAAGASMIFLSAFDCEKVIRYLPSATVFMGVPTFYTRLLAHHQFSATVCNNIRLFISGSAPMLEKTHEQFTHRTGQSILERYGMTETGMLASNPLQGERRAGTVGLALPQVQVRIVDAGHNAVKPGEVGSIQVKGPNVFHGYWQMPQKTASEFTEDGFFVTGDLGLMSADGYITITGRSSDMIISGGYNVYPKEIETIIDAVAGVRESAVFAVAHAGFGEAVTAAVVCNEDAQIDENLLINAARKKLAAYKVPKKIVFLNELPRNTMGKVQKNLLRARFTHTDENNSVA